MGVSAQSKLIPTDSSSVDERVFNQETIEQFQNQRAYNYDKNPKYEQNTLRRWWLNFLRRIQEGLGDDASQTIWDVIQLVIMVLGIGILLNFLFRSNKTRVFKKSDGSPEPDGIILKSENAKANIKQLILEAENTGNFTTAIRYQFLDILRVLDEKKLIKWNESKTNLNYINELKELKERESFSRLAHIFEYLVYGEFNIDESKYSKYKLEFHEFIENLNL